MTARQKTVDFLLRRGFFVVFALILRLLLLATSHFFRAGQYPQHLQRYGSTRDHRFGGGVGGDVGPA